MATSSRRTCGGSSGARYWAWWNPPARSTGLLARSASQKFSCDISSCETVPGPPQKDQCFQVLTTLRVGATRRPAYKTRGGRIPRLYLTDDSAGERNRGHRRCAHRVSPHDGGESRATKSDGMDRRSNRGEIYRTALLVPWNRGSLHKARAHFVCWQGATPRLPQRACRAEG